MNKQNQTKAPIRWPRVLILGSLLFTVYAVVIVIIHNFIGVISVVIGVLLCLFLFPWVGERFVGENWAIGASWVGMFLGIILAFTNTMAYITYVIYPEGSTARDVAVKDAFIYDKPVLFFSDGAVRTDMISSVYDQGYTPSKTGGWGRYWASETAVAPLVWDGWSKGEEVTAWVVCAESWERDVEINEINTCTREWGKLYRAGYSVSALDRVEAKDAVKQAEKDHQIRSHPDAMIIYWSQDPFEHARTGVKMFWSIFAFFELIWVIALIVKRNDFPIVEG